MILPNEDRISPNVTRTHYFAGREHAAVKHYFLRQYVEVLAFKTLQFQRGTNRCFAYVDGFTGPWGAKDDAYADTSFGTALEILKKVKTRLPGATIRCAFCESRPKAFSKLNDYLRQNASGIETRCFPGRFEEHIPEITNFVGRNGFLFAFLDPTGWTVDSKLITPLLKGRWAEVLFNFMAEFIGRFPDYEKVSKSYASLLADVDWRSRYEALPDYLPNDEKILLLFRGLLKERWGFTHVLELPIKKASRDRVFYKLVYGTRSSHGVLAFRDAQAKAEREGYATAIEAQQGEQQRLFSADEEADYLAKAIGVGSSRHLVRLEEKLKEALADSGTASVLDLAGDALEEIPARLQDVKVILAKMRGNGDLIVTNSDHSTSISTKSICRSTVRP